MSTVGVPGGRAWKACEDVSMEILKRWMEEVDESTLEETTNHLPEPSPHPPVYSSHPASRPEPPKPASVPTAPHVAVEVAAAAPANDSQTIGTRTVCMETLPQQLFPRRRTADTCRREPKTRLGCLARSVQTDLQERGGRVRYPECGETLGFDDVRRFAKPDVFER